MMPSTVQHQFALAATEPRIDSLPIGVESQAPSATSLSREETEEPHPSIKRSTSVVALRYRCYVLHGFLSILQIVLFAMLWNHPEHKVTVASDNSVLTTGLSAFLQAFYTLYTALLVFVTQRLVLTDLLSRSQKLTATHDVSAAWAGVGAATAILWQQTKIAASTTATLLVFLYLACISVLHVASPTLMVFQPYNATNITAVPSNMTWPNPSVNLTTLDMAAVGQLIPLMSNLEELSTDGLINSTVYDTFSKTPQMIYATVNANTIQANCGLLSNLTYIDDGQLSINASMSGVGEVNFVVSSFDEISLLFSNAQSEPLQYRNLALVYLVSTGMNVDGSIGNNVSVVMNVTSESGGQTQNISMTAYVVACSLGVSNYKYTLEIQNGSLGPTVDQPDGPSQAWSLWTPTNDSGTQLNQMVSSALALTSSSFGAAEGTIEVYFASLLGVNISASDASSNTSITLTPNQFENALSQIAARLIWIAGQFGVNDGGFTQTTNVAEVTEQVPRWRLNIQVIPVVFTFSTSFILLIIVYLLLGTPSKPAQDIPLVEGTSVLEMLWIGAHTSSLRKRLKAIGRPSLDKLRPGGMFDVYLSRHETAQESSEHPEAAALLNPQISSFEFEDATDGTRTEQRRNLQRQTRALSFIRSSRRLWCYLLHAIFILLHIVLLLMLIRHPEHRIILESDNEVSTTTLAVSLQLFYVVYTLILVFMTQQLAISRAVTQKQSLTCVHDLSQAWTGIGSALVGLWQQTKVTASIRMMLAITIYYGCVLVLHVASTTIIRFEVFTSNKNNTAQSTLAWPTSSFCNTTYSWGELSPIVPLGQLPSLSTKGLQNGTVYDMPSVDSTSVDAIINATTIYANCGLLSNLSLNPESNSISTVIPTLGLVNITGFPTLWKDTIMSLGYGVLCNASNPASMLECSECAGYLVYLVTTALDFDNSSDEVVSVNTNWTFTPPGGKETWSNTTTYIVACSLNATTTLDILDVQNYILANTSAPQLMGSHSQSWQLWSPGGMTGLGSEISTALVNSVASADTHYIEALDYPFSPMDIYTMSLFGINSTANVATSKTQSSADPSVILGASQFEDAISKIVAQYIWAAGHTNGNFGPTYGFGESVVTSLKVQWRLNVNTIPVVIATAASVILFILAFYMVGVGSLTPSAITELGVLQVLWMEAHSEMLHECMLQVEDPIVYNLRVAGMFDVCLADDVREVLDRDE